MLASLLYGLAVVLNMVLNFATVVIMISVFITWFDASPYNRYVDMVRSLTEPLYRPIRRITRGITGPIDFAPLILGLVVVFLQKSLVKYLFEVSQRIGLD